MFNVHFHTASAGHCQTRWNGDGGDPYGPLMLRQSGRFLCGQNQTS